MLFMGKICYICTTESAYKTKICTFHGANIERICTFEGA